MVTIMLTLTQTFDLKYGFDFDHGQYKLKEHLLIFLCYSIITITLISILLLFFIAIITAANIFWVYGTKYFMINKNMCWKTMVENPLLVYTEFILVPIVQKAFQLIQKHSQIRSWNQPLLSNECKVSCTRKQRLAPDWV